MENIANDLLSVEQKKVVGIDISEKMLEVARNENSDPNIIYINMPMEKIAELNEQFDIVVRNKVIRYILILRIMVSREKESQYGLLIM